MVSKSTAIPAVTDIAGNAVTANGTKMAAASMCRSSPRRSCMPIEHTARVATMLARTPRLLAHLPSVYHHLEIGVAART